MFKTVCSEEHKHHFPKGELSGGQLVRPFECPERWEYIRNRLTTQGHTQFASPNAVAEALLTDVHTPDYIEFLKTAWRDWEAEGFEGEAIPTVFPARRMQQRVPTFIDGKLGYYAMAMETAITAGTWQAAISSADCAVSAQREVSAGEREVFALCRPPGHHAASDLYGGYCFFNNAALAASGFLRDGAKRVAILDRIFSIIAMM